ncbi:MAG: MerR family transcriptional regulator [Chloroflexota bacterium]|jgi:DNA-binding transcriptional MerR regulator
MQYRPQEAAQRLGIASSTLRLWSTHFASELSEIARKVDPSGAGPIAQRRYTDDDIRVLSQVKQLLGQGLTYEEVKRRLRPPTIERANRDHYLSAERPSRAREQYAISPHRAIPHESRMEMETPVTAVPEEIHLSITGLKEALDAKDKTISALKESLGFLDVYLHALKEERDDARRRVRELEQELDEQREIVRELERQLLKPWWKRMLGVQ